MTNASRKSERELRRLQEFITSPPNSHFSAASGIRRARRAVQQPPSGLDKRTSLRTKKTPTKKLRPPGGHDLNSKGRDKVDDTNCFQSPPATPNRKTCEALNGTVVWRAGELAVLDCQGGLNNCVYKLLEPVYDVLSNDGVYDFIGMRVKYRLSASKRMDVSKVDWNTREVQAAENMGGGVFRLSLQKPPGIQLPTVYTTPLMYRVHSDEACAQLMGPSEATFEFLSHHSGREAAEKTAVEAMLLCGGTPPPKPLQQHRQL